MKHDIEIPDLPDGWEAVAYRYGYKGETGFDKELFTIDMEKTDYPLIIVRKKQTRRIVLEETGEIRQYCYLLELDDGNLILPPGREYKIVEEDNKCAG